MADGESSAGREDVGRYYALIHKIRSRPECVPVEKRIVTVFETEEAAVEKFKGLVESVVGKPNRWIVTLIRVTVVNDGATVSLAHMCEFSGNLY